MNLFINEVGMVSPVGLNALSACAAKRAGISAFAELPYIDNDSQPIVGAAVPGLDEMRSAPLRSFELLVMVLRELLAKQTDLNWDRVPLLVCLAEQGRPGGNATLADTVIQRLQRALRIRFHPVASSALADGHTGPFAALHEAGRLVVANDAPACIICGADSFLNASTLLWLDRNYRLKTPANRDGVVPGEAAAAVLLQARPQTHCHVRLVGLGFGQEDAPILSEKPLLGHGLATAVRQALAEAELGLHQIDLRLSDVTGELYGFKELPLMEGRLMRVVRNEAQPLWHWAEAIGDTGAAAGVAQLVLTDQAFRKGYAPGRHALCLASGVSGKRAAAVLQDLWS